MKRACARLWEVDALREGRLEGRDAGSFLRHRESCAECRQRFAHDEKLRALGQALPVAPIDPLHARRLRQAILRKAAPGDDRAGSRRSNYAVPFAAVALVAALLIGTRSSTRAVVSTQPPPAASVAAFGATIDPEPGAAWSEATEGAIERVKLTKGAITLRVRHRAASERFFVDLPDGQIEVRGTQFRVEVEEGTTRSVAVSEGLVALRRLGADEVLIGAHERWTAALSEAASAARATGPASPEFAWGAANRARTADGHSAPRGAPSPHTAREATSRGEDTAEYEAAVELFMAQHYDEASRRLHAFAVAHSERVEAEDAAFLEASALTHMGRTDAAGVVAERFLDRYPTSLHASDAAVLAVRAARARGDCAHARLVASRPIPDAQRATALGVCGAP